LELYRNLGRTSGVRAFEIDDEAIIVQFKDGAKYLYTYGSTGEKAIEKMKLLALKGKGLNSYISRVIRKRFARKIA
jgi:hypothetical protein